MFQIYIVNIKKVKKIIFTLMEKEKLLQKKYSAVIISSNGLENKAEYARRRKKLLSQLKSPLILAGIAREPGSEEEYKARHDVLVEARGDKVTEGPDSNFSIWNAGGYIFGYNEIDTTMERDRTEEDRQGDIAWETRMLEIMSWLTDDVDWITGMCHENIRRICWHN